MTDDKSSRVEKLRSQRDQLNARIQKLDAAEKNRQHKQDVQRKVVVGAYYLEKMQKENRWDELVAIMDSHLARNSDRKLFDLPPHEKTPAPPLEEVIE